MVEVRASVNQRSEAGGRLVLTRRTGMTHARSRGAEMTQRLTGESPVEMVRGHDGLRSGFSVGLVLLSFNDHVLNGFFAEQYGNLIVGERDAARAKTRGCSGKDFFTDFKA